MNSEVAQESFDSHDFVFLNPQCGGLLSFIITVTLEIAYNYMSVTTTPLGFTPNWRH